MSGISEDAAALAARVRQETDIGSYVPGRDRVLVLPLREEGEREHTGDFGRLILPGEGHEAKHDRALVIAVGPGTLIPKTGVRVPVDAEPDDVVIVGDAIGEPVFDSEGTEYRLVRGGDILGVLTP